MKWYFIAAIALAVPLLIWHFIPREEVSVAVDEVIINDVYVTTSGITVNLTVRVLVHNPYPFDVHISRIVYDIYAINSEEKFLGHGEKKDIVIYGDTTTEVDVPVYITADYLTLGDLLISAISKGSITIKVTGSVYIDVKLTTVRKDFEVVREIPLG